MDSLINEFNTACKEGNLEQVKYLIKNKSLNINRQDNKGNTGFHYACIKGHLPIVEYFKVDAFACFWHFVPKSKQMYLPGPLRYKKYKFKC